MKSLGGTLKQARELAPFTLRQVEDATGISNAYLSQLENDKIKKPSANVLYKLSSLYKIELNTLLAASGIIEETNKNLIEVKPGSDWLNRLAHYSDDFSEAQKDEIMEFIKYMKFKNKNQ
ncbi:MAG: helix-turn-helix domain-containing protein [Flavobacterium sp.]|nr:MAG: helix-turn-helix domain-containing protein [Flavobacterium sp.]